MIDFIPKPPIPRKRYKLQLWITDVELGDRIRQLSTAHAMTQTDFVEQALWFAINHIRKSDADLPNKP